jgi:TonB-dependent starch-binding outer membrane protein SusC
MKTKLIPAIILCLIIATPVLSGQKAKKTITIKGIVIDDRKEPVVGAILVVDREQTRSYTDIYGKFKLKVNPDAVSIGVVISKNMFVEKPISGRKELTINIPYEAHQKIVSQITNPDDEAINIGYGTVKKEELGSRISKIDASKNNYAAYSSINEIISELMLGVALKNNSQGLYIVDGVIMSDVSSIPPSQVKSIEILKGSAALIYGSKGVNGAFLITLRKGGDK